MSLNNNEVRIYARQGNDWNHIDTLTEVRVLFHPLILSSRDEVGPHSMTSPSLPSTGLRAPTAL